MNAKKRKNSGSVLDGKTNVLNTLTTLTKIKPVTHNTTITGSSVIKSFNGFSVMMLQNSFMDIGDTYAQRDVMW